jgi:hypothetical protein
MPVDGEHSVSGVYNVGSMLLDWNLVGVVSLSCSGMSVLDDLGHGRHRICRNATSMVDHDDTAKQET